MKLIIAQGNPDSQYHDTRHNVGFHMLNAFAESVGVSWAEKPKFRAYVAEYTYSDEKVLLVKPTTYYNDTGVSARALLDFYKINTTDVLVIHDDIALPLGTIRTRDKGSDAGNNGIKSLNAHLGADYKRVRVGIWTELADRMEATAFVLSKFTKDEQKILTDIRPTIFDIIEDFLCEHFTTTSHKTIL